MARRGERTETIESEGLRWRERTVEVFLRSRNAITKSGGAGEHPDFLKFRIESMHSGALRGTRVGHGGTLAAVVEGADERGLLVAFE